jgi:hypothetical protein
VDIELVEIRGPYPLKADGTITKGALGSVLSTFKWGRVAAGFLCAFLLSGAGGIIYAIKTSLIEKGAESVEARIREERLLRMESGLRDLEKRLSPDAARGTPDP